MTTLIKKSNYVTPEFTISTGDGYKYVFGGIFNAVEYNVFADDQTMVTPSAFLLRKIVAPNGNEAKFSYGHHLKETKQILAYYTNLAAENENHYQYSSIKYHKTVISVFAPPVTEIAVNGKPMIEFTYKENGYDENSKESFDYPLSLVTHYFLFYHQDPVDLRKIVINDYYGSEVASMTFEKLFIGNSPSRMFLSIINSTLGGKYTFYYKKDSLGPPHNNTTAMDYWGF